jgi:hypothetical protein
MINVITISKAELCKGDSFPIKLKNYELIYEWTIWRTTRCDKDKCIPYASSL